MAGAESDFAWSGKLLIGCEGFIPLPLPRPPRAGARFLGGGSAAKRASLSSFCPLMATAGGAGVARAFANGDGVRWGYLSIEPSLGVGYAGPSEAFECM